MKQLSLLERFRSVILNFFPYPLFFLLLLSCNQDPGVDPFSPVDQPPGGYQPAPPTTSELQMDINLTLRQGQGTNSALLAVVRDDSTSDSLNLYIDVEVTNVRPEIVFLAAEIDTLTLVANVRFIDYPHYRFFNHGRLRLAVGQTFTGLEATDVFEADFSSDTTIVVGLPLSRIDSFRIADNVAVNGRVVVANRFIEASLVRRFETPEPPTGPPPNLVGFVRSKDIFRNRLYIINPTVGIADSTRITVVISDSTRFESPNGELITLNSLKTGDNELTITAMAWALAGDNSIIANGWEFNRFTLTAIRPLTP